MRAILDLRPDAIFVFSESTEYVHPGSPDIVQQAHFMNERRFLSLDLLFGHDVTATIYRYLLASGMTPEEYLWFMGNRDLRTPLHHGDRLLHHQRARAPAATARASAPATSTATTSSRGSTSTATACPSCTPRPTAPAKHAVEWLWKEWMNLLRLREDGVPIVGFTWFGLVDMKDWDTALTKIRGTVNPVGLYTLARKQRKVAREYRRLVEEYSHLPISSTKFPILTASDPGRHGPSFHRAQTTARYVRPRVLDRDDPRAVRPAPQHYCARPVRSTADPSGPNGSSDHRSQ